MTLNSLKRAIFYDAGPVITKASFIGFCYNTSETMCRHRSCGYKEPARICPKCKRKHSAYAYDCSGSPDPESKDFNPHHGKRLKTRQCTTNKESYIHKLCDFDIEQAPIVGGEKVKCKLTRFRAYTMQELANPTTKPRYALIEVEFAAITGTHMFVADLDDVDFVNCEMTVNWQGDPWTAYKGTFRAPVDISKIVNKKEVIEQIGKVFGQ